MLNGAIIAATLLQTGMPSIKWSASMETSLVSMVFSYAFFIFVLVLNSLE